ncbi:ArsR/SmtB family transcription factor [Alkalispirochaeta sphaeroplastigenens]|uniref:ArsR/SmtB family transcription factor n=1 Tax=Alkalispirochaeta sphaeroplastigenens TaxID=1187066 RepID=UPI000CDADC04|nr:metalloregulator ArsR/SmtB family transcription factor [Alkalispirochaeta sphaeroplastigenens]
MREIASAGETNREHRETRALRERRGQLPSPEVTAGAARFFRGMADQTRLRILVALAQEPTCVGDLCLLLSLEQSAVSHQLRLLRELRLVSARRRGRHMVYSLEDDHVLQLVREAVAHASHSSCPG